jgi:flagellar hook-basal body complex protein FliE
MINGINPNISNIQPPQAVNKADKATANFKDYLEKVDLQQQTGDQSVSDLLSGKNPDINSVVAEVAKADMSFKLLVGVRNKIVEAYKQTMQMQI